MIEKSLSLLESVEKPTARPSYYIMNPGTIQPQIHEYCQSFSVLFSPASFPVKKITGKDSDCPSFVIGKIMIY